MVRITFDGEVVQRNKSFKPRSRPEEAVMIAMKTKISCGKNMKHCGIYNAKTQKCSDASFIIKGKGKSKRRYKNKRNMKKKKVMTMKDQQVNMMNTCIEENKVIDAILKKAKKNVIEANILFSKLKDAPEDHLQDETSKIWDLVETVNENVRAFAKELQWNVEQMTTIKNKLKTITDIERESKKEFWHDVFAFHKGEGQHPKITKKKSNCTNVPKSNERIYMAASTEKNNNDWRIKWENTIKNEIDKSVSAGVLLPCESSDLTSHKVSNTTISSQSHLSTMTYSNKPFSLSDSEGKEPLFDTDEEYYTSDDNYFYDDDTTLDELNTMDKNWKRKRLHEQQGDFFSNYKRNRIGTIHLLRGDDSVALAKTRLAPTTASAYMTTTIPDDKVISDFKASEVTLEGVLATSRHLLEADDEISILSSNSEKEHTKATNPGDSASTKETPKETKPEKKSEENQTTKIRPVTASVLIKSEPIKDD